MFYRVQNIKLPLSYSEALLQTAAARKLNVSEKQIKNVRIYRRSLDARRGKLAYVFSLDVYLKENRILRTAPDVIFFEKEETYSIPRFSPRTLRPVVVGFGPAGMFTALLLARSGLCPLVLERGRKVEERQRDVNRFFATGVLDPSSNVQFGEGGAGTFSDGKLNTLLKDKNHRGRFVLSEMVKAGAPEEILYLAKPHVGTDQLREVVKNLREEILSLGGEIRFETRLSDLSIRSGVLTGVFAEKGGVQEEIPCDTLFLAPGHSARDTFEMLRARGIAMEKKPFSVGVRIEHPQSFINSVQYSGANDPQLPPADYKMSCLTSSGKRLYTFCMCPGGTVVPAASEEGGVVTNGMSSFLRDGKNANSALLFSVSPEELPADLFSGIHFQMELEKKAYLAGGGEYRAPAQLVGDFLKGEKSVSARLVQPSYARGVTFTDLSAVFSEKEILLLREGILGMDAALPGFASPDAVLTAVESRSTSPVRILRGEDYSSSLPGLYPVGEGAGFAGGILSAAMDGMKCADAYFEKLKESQ